MAQPIEYGYDLHSEPFHSLASSERFATADDSIFVERYRVPSDPGFDFGKFVSSYEAVRERFLALDMESYVPEVVDFDSEDHWIAFGVTPGAYNLREAAISHQGGIQGRDWAWICRRILISLAISGRRPRLSADDILILPEKHSIILIGWSIEEGYDSYPLDELKDLMERWLYKSKDVQEQIDLIGRFSTAYKRNRRRQYEIPVDPEKKLFGYDEAVKEYELKIGQLYGPRKFKEFKVDSSISAMFLDDDSREVLNLKEELRDLRKKGHL